MGRWGTVPDLNQIMPIGLNAGRQRPCRILLRNRRAICVFALCIWMRCWRSLDGLDLRNEDIRLFMVERNKNGYAPINRIQVSEKLINEGQLLSKLWINGRFEGI